MENEAKKKLKALGEKILETSRSELYLSMRFLDMAFAELPYEMNMSTFLIGTEGLTLQYNPRFLAQRYQDNPVKVNRAYLHTIMHCLFRHMYIMEEREEEVFHIACDIAVEFLIDQLNFPSVQQLVSDDRQEWYDRLQQQLKVMTAEGIYQRLMGSNLSHSELIQLECAFLVDDHRFWDAKKKENTNNNKKDSKEPTTQSKNENPESTKENNSVHKNKKQANRWKELSEKINTNAEMFQRQAGNEIKQLLTGIRVTNRERYDYKEFLRKFAILVENIQVDDNSFDYAFYHYGIQMYHNVPLIEPLEYKESLMIEEFVVAIDTSGSCSEQLIKKFVEETFSILKSTQSYGRQLNLHILQCDNEVKEDILIEDRNQLEEYQEKFTIKGFGGTDYRPVFAYVEQLRQERKLKNLKGLIYFTDGYGIFPERRTDYETVFVFMEEENMEVKVPSWAMKLILDPMDMKP